MPTGPAFLVLAFHHDVLPLDTDFQLTAQEAIGVHSVGEPAALVHHQLARVLARLDQVVAVAVVAEAVVELIPVNQAVGAAGSVEWDEL